MKVLYLVDAAPDYQSDDLLYGFRSLLGSDVVDYPRKDVLYVDSGWRTQADRIYGRGFHCFGLDDLPIDRTDILAKVSHGYFDVIINSSGWRIDCPLHPRLVVVDGEDHETFVPKYDRRVPLYFKRELPEPLPAVEPILFALPDFLYDGRVIPRTKQIHASFSPNSEIRRELVARFAPRYSFETWEDYVSDIKRSWFAISPKGFGYDCQRHYEILGQAVLCIFMGERSPWLMRKCFLDDQNCLTFRSVEELIAKIDGCREPQRLIDRARTELLGRHLASKRAAQVLAAIARHGIARYSAKGASKLEWLCWLRLKAPRHSKSSVFGPRPAVTWRTIAKSLMPPRLRGDRKPAETWRAALRSLTPPILWSGMRHARDRFVSRRRR